MMTKTATNTSEMATDQTITASSQIEYENDAIFWHSDELENRDPYPDHVIFS